jgi:nucleoside permease NupC
MFALSVAGILALASVIGLTAACFTVAAILVAIAALMLYIFLLPYRKSSEEIDDLEESTANALADLPFDTLKSLVQKYPVSVSAGAMLLGYTLVRDPKTATRHAQRLLLGLL